MLDRQKPCLYFLWNPFLKQYISAKYFSFDKLTFSTKTVWLQNSQLPLSWIYWTNYSWNPKQYLSKLNCPNDFILHIIDVFPSLSSFLFCLCKPYGTSFFDEVISSEQWFRGSSLIDLYDGVFFQYRFQHHCLHPNILFALLIDIIYWAETVIELFREASKSFFPSVVAGNLETCKVH